MSLLILPGFQQKKAQACGRRLIQELDTEGKFIPDAEYSLQGRTLKEYLACAYFQGYRDAAERASFIVKALAKHEPV